MRRRTIALSLATVASCGLASGSSAQTGDTARSRSPSPAADSLRVLVEYVAGPNLYLGNGAKAGLEANDTVDVVAAQGSSRGRLRVISSSEERSVVAFVGPPFPVTRGDSLTILLPTDRPLAAVAAADTAIADTAGAAAQAGPPAPAADSVPPRFVPQPPSQPAQRGPSPRLDGSIAFDVDATSSRAADGPGANDPWRFVTPTIRLHAAASDVPGGLRMLVSASWAQYYANAGAGPDRTDHLRIYQAEITKTSSAVQLRAGRFFDRHDIWGGYLDGASLRIGGTGNGPGIGVSAGLSPVGAEQDLFSGSNRFSVFADFRHRSSRFGYDMDVAFTRRTWSDAPADHYLGLTQRIRFGSASIYQRARVEIDPVDSSPDLAQFDLLSVLPLGSGWMMRGQYQRRSYAWVAGSGVTAVQHRERAGGGLSWSGSAGSVALDAQVMQWGDRARAPMYSGSLYLPRLIGPVGFSANVSINRDPGIRSTFLSPGLLLQAGALGAAVSWRSYRTNTSEQKSETSGTSFSLSVRLRRGLQASIRGDFRSGTGATSRRLYTGLWASF